MSFKGHVSYGEYEQHKLDWENDQINDLEDSTDLGEPETVTDKSDDDISVVDDDGVEPVSFSKMKNVSVNLSVPRMKPSDDLIAKWKLLTPSFTVISPSEHKNDFHGKPNHPDGFEFLYVDKSSPIWAKEFYKRGVKSGKRMIDRWDMIHRYIKRITKSKTKMENLKLLVEGRILVFVDGCRLSYCHVATEIAKGTRDPLLIKQNLDKRFAFEIGNYIEKIESIIPFKSDIIRKYKEATQKCLLQIRKFIPDIEDQLLLPLNLQSEFDRLVHIIENECGTGVLSQPKYSKFHHIVSVDLNPEDYLQCALSAPSPFSALPEVENTAFLPCFMQAVNPDIVKHLRSKRRTLLHRITKIVQPIYEEIEQFRPESAKRVGPQHKPLLLSVLGELTSNPDTDLGFELFWGMKIVGRIEACGAMRQNYEKELLRKPRDVDLGSYSFIKRQCRRLQGKPFEDTDRVMRQKSWKELDKFESIGPFDIHEMNQFWAPNKWKSLLRFITWSANKHREIDSGKASKHNESSVLEDRISCASISTPDVLALITHKFWRLMGEEFKAKSIQFSGSTEDLQRAYRQVPVCVEMLRYNVTMLPLDQSVMFCIILALVFGLSAAVVNFNRLSLFLESLARSLLMILISHYFDDFNILENNPVVWQGKIMFKELCDILGWLLDPGKSKNPDPLWRWLGAMKLFDLLGVNTYMDEDRCTDMIDMVLDVLKKNKLTPGLAKTIRGKYGFINLAKWGKCGRALLRALIDRGEADGSIILLDEPLRAALNWLIWFVKVVPQTRTFFCSDDRPVVQIFPDASSEEVRIIKPGFYKRWLKMMGVANGRKVRLGWVSFETHEQISAGWADISDAFLLAWAKSQPIAQAEALGCLLSIIVTIGDRTDLDLNLFCDNQVVCNCLVKGSSREGYVDQVCNLIHVWCASRRIRLFVEWTPSANNPGDEPSRDCSVGGIPVQEFIVNERLKENLAGLMGSNFDYHIAQLLQVKKDDVVRAAPCK